MLRQALAHLGRQALHLGIVQVGRNRLALLRTELLHLELLAGDVPGVLRLDLHLLGHHWVRHPRPGGLDKRPVGHLGTLEEVNK